MNITRHLVFVAATAITVCFAPCFCQDTAQTSPDLSGSGSTGKIPVWKNSTTLGNSQIVQQSSGNVGIGTNNPAAKLEVNGDAQVDGNFTLSGSIFSSGGLSLIWANVGTYNFSAGLGALPPNTSGTANTAVGNGALQVNASGYHQAAIGYNALASNTGGFNNTAIGYEALILNTTGADNTAIGSEALLVNTTGTSNTATGAYALYNNTSGSNNIAVGCQAGQNITTTSNNIPIGNLGVSTDSATIRIGCKDSNTCASGELPQTSTYIAGIYGSATGLANVPVVVDSNGNLGTMSSSRRFKQDIRDMADSSDGLMKLRPVTFRYKKAYDDGSKAIQYGLIAEEVAEVYPDLVARSSDGQVEAVKYQLLDPMLLNELQKQHATIAAQKEQIQAQEQQIQDLQERLAKIEAMIERKAVVASVR